MQKRVARADDRTGGKKKKNYAARRKMWRKEEEEEEEKSRPLFQLFIVRRTDNLNSPISLSLHILNAAICARKFAVLRQLDPTRATDAQMQKLAREKGQSRSLARLKYKFHMRFRLFRNEITDTRRVSRNALARFRNHGL